MARHTIVNPKSGRRVLKTSRLGKAITAKSKKKTGQAKVTKKPTKQPVGKINKPKKTTPFKPIGNTMRLSASHYFHKIHNGKLKKCQPELVPDVNGKYRIKEIKMVDGPHGKHPRWVLSK